MIICCSVSLVVLFCLFVGFFPQSNAQSASGDALLCVLVSAVLGVLTRGEQSQPPRLCGEDTAGRVAPTLRVLSALTVRSFLIISVNPPSFFNCHLNFSCFTVVKVVQLECLVS